MANYDDVEYLRGVVASYRHKLDEIRNHAAGARIAGLEAEVERLRGENERLAAESEKNDDDAYDWEDIAIAAVEILKDISSNAMSPALRMLAQDAAPVLERYRAMTGDDTE